ncbi:PqqD family protein [Salinithrix halophila]|uniref:PqqD family protein n=2 Tax=Salinithrix halophila TaxID=1485204 RepID=A0ABV8JFP7_9BACL
MLTMKPVLKEEYRLETGSGEGLILVIPRTSWLERLSIRWLNQPDAIRVQLDDLGSFVLTYCNGKATVREIADGLEKVFGEKAKPVLPRLVQYLRIAETNSWIAMKPSTR